MLTTPRTAFMTKALIGSLLLLSSLAAHASLKENTEYYIWLNIYEKLLGSNEDGTEPALSAYGKNTDADSYIFVAEPSGTDGYVLLRQKIDRRYLAASSTNNWSVVFEDTPSTDSRFLWKVDEGTYTYLINKKNNKYLGVDGANKGKDYVSVFYDKPKGSHSQFSVIPVVGNTWAEARQAYESAIYTNEQGISEIDYCQLKDKTIDRSDAIDIHITSNSTPMSGTTKVNLGSDRTWLIIDNIVPSTVISTYLKYVTINGQAASNGSNCRVAIFLNGAAIIPKPQTVMTCQGTTGEFTLAVGNHTNLGKNSNAMTSFVLRRGYMATLASGTDGSGHSRVYVADHADLEITLPQSLTKRVTSVNVKQWQYLSKKGWGNTSGKSGADQLRATWFWSWSAGYSSTTDLEYVPCKQHRYWPSASEVNNKTATASLSLNEPEHSEQHTSDKCSCGGTINEWAAYGYNSDFQAGGGRIGSPQPTDLGYLTNYFNYVDQNNNHSRCDFAVTHAYWDLAGYNETDYANWFCNSQCKSVWNNTGRPLWLTEMEISASWNSNKVTSYEQNRKYLQVLLQKIEECPWIERYAIYGVDMWQTYMFYEANPSKGLTPAGQVYRDHRSTFAYNAKYTKTPAWWAPGIKAPTLDYTISAAQNTITFTLGNTNGDATDQLILQRKVGDEWQDLYTVTDRSLLENSKVTHKVSLDEIDHEKDVFRVACTNLYGSTATSEEQGTGLIVNPGINTASKENVPGWTCVRNAANGFTKAASGDTYLEVWNSTAADIDFNYYQDLNDIPNGVYSLSAVCFNSTDHVEGATLNGAVGLYATADGVTYFEPVTTDSEIDYTQKTTVPLIVVRNGTLRIGIRNVAPMTGRWAGADDFELLYLGTEKQVLTNTSYEEVVAEADQRLANCFPAIDNEQRDATRLIGNADCSRSTSNFWTTTSLSTNTGEAYDGNTANPYFNIWKSGAYSSSLEQEITNLPAGQYVLSTLLRGSTGQSFSLKAIHTPAGGQATTYTKTVTGTGSTTTGGNDFQNGWQKAELETLTIHHGDKLTISAEATFGGTAWWSIDHFQLRYAPLPLQPDAIGSIKSPSATTATYHTLDGRTLQGRPAPGIYILRQADGTTRKVLIR